MPTVQIVGLPKHLQITEEAQGFATADLPRELSSYKELGVERGPVVVQYLEDGVRRDALRLTVHVFDLFVRETRTAEVRRNTAELIRGALLALCEVLGARVASITVCLGAFVADEHGYASYPE